MIASFFNTVGDSETAGASPEGAPGHDGWGDEQIIAAVNQGNPALFEVIVRRHNQRLFRVGMSYLRHPEQVEDAMQETYLKAFLHLPSFHGHAAFSTWVTRIMINECLLVLRRGRDRRPEAPAEAAPEPATDTDHTRQAATLQEMKALLERTVAALPSDLRVVFILREVQHLNTQETAETLEISPENVRVRLHRARELLKDGLLASAAGLELFTFGQTNCARFTARIMARLSVRPE